LSLAERVALPLPSELAAQQQQLPEPHVHRGPTFDAHDIVLEVETQRRTGKPSAPTIKLAPRSFNYAALQAHLAKDQQRRDLRRDFPDATAAEIDRLMSSGNSAAAPGSWPTPRRPRKRSGKRRLGRTR
jgi:hypothetical protein